MHQIIGDTSPITGNNMADEAKIDNDESLNVADQDTDTDLDTNDDESAADAGIDSEDVDELKEKLKEKDKLNQKLFERAKKAEGFEKQPDGSWVKVEKKPKAEKQEPTHSDELGAKDVMALINAKVTEDSDIDEVKDYAKHKGISISEALKTTVVKTILSERAEERATANATNIGKSRAANTKNSGQSLLEKANKTGEVPEGEDLDRMLEARYTPKSE